MPTVLVVDDEPAVRQLASRMLRQGGYDTIEVPGGREAWAYLQRSGVQVDAAVVDVVMPGMSGTELVAMLREVHPELPVLLMSGYTAGDLVQRGLERYTGPLLTKPFTQEGLLAGVDRLLGPLPHSRGGSAS
ncbi:MAG TPA: response regulator [Gemmatimonadales bacterium]|nr:response regulator [Gemmatimonadales bacterium]